MSERKGVDYVDIAHKALVAQWFKTHPFMVAGFRDDIGDILQWVAYCTHNQPVTYDFYHRMQCNSVAMPNYSDEQVLEAVNGLPDGEVKEYLLPWIKREAEQ